MRNEESNEIYANYVKAKLEDDFPLTIKQGEWLIKQIDFIKTLTDPDTITENVFKVKEDKRFVDANDMVYWIIEQANKLLEESK